MTSRSKYIASLGGVGYSRWAPGTMGSLGAVIFWPLWCIVPSFLHIGIWITLFFMSLWVCFDSMHEEEDVDPSWIVIDEALAVWLIPVFFAGRFSSAWIVAWLLFRLLDITKPWPISWTERLTPAPCAVIMDDIVAVMLALLLTRFWWC